MTPDKYEAIVRDYHQLVKCMDKHRNAITHDRMDINAYIDINLVNANAYEAIFTSLETTDHLLECTYHIPSTLLNDHKSHQRIQHAVKQNPDKDTIAYLTLQGFFEPKADCIYFVSSHSLSRLENEIGYIRSLQDYYRNRLD